MAEIDTAIKEEIKKWAKNYMTAIKGKALTKEDIMIAENLIMFGYLKAKEDEITLMMNENGFLKNGIKETQAIISSEWK